MLNYIVTMFNEFNFYLDSIGDNFRTVFYGTFIMLMSLNVISKISYQMFIFNSPNWEHVTPSNPVDEMLIWIYLIWCLHCCYLAKEKELKERFKI